MQLASIIRTREQCSLTLSGIRLASDIDITLAPGPGYVARPLVLVGSAAGSMALAVGRDGRAGLLFGGHEIAPPPDIGRWCRRALAEALAHEDLDDAAGYLADRLLADDRESISGLLAEYEQCHSVRFSGRGQPYVTTMRGNCGLLSFWNEYPGLSFAESAYERFEQWVEAGLENPLGLHSFHIPNGPGPEGSPAGAPCDVAQIRVGADGLSAQIRLWIAPRDESARPSLSLSLPLRGANLVANPCRAGAATSGAVKTGNISQNQTLRIPKLPDKQSGQK
jgi:hypothetical protein